MNPTIPNHSDTLYRFRFLFAFLAACIVVCPARSYAGEKPEAFETITLGAQFIYGTASEEFADIWDPSNGALVLIDSPFYLGAVEVGIHLFRNNNLSSDVPPFRSVNFFLGWGIEWALPLRIGWFTGIRAGGLYMNFDDDDVADEVKTESELAFGLSTALRYPLGDRWSVLVSGQYLRVFTYHRIEYSFFGAGVSRSFTMPRGLREFLE